MAERVEASGGQDAPHLAELTDVSNVLLLAPSIGAAKTDACHTLLTQTKPENTNVLTVSFTKTAQEWVDEWDAHAGAPPSRGGMVSIGQAEASVEDPAWAVEAIEAASDLTGIGIKLSELLTSMADAAEDDEAIAVCFDSVTSLLQYADLQRTFRFLHVVTGRIKTVGGVGHFHVDPEAHSNRDLATLKGLFDAVVEVDDDGNYTVTR